MGSAALPIPVSGTTAPLPNMHGVASAAALWRDDIEVCAWDRMRAGIVQDNARSGTYHRSRTFPNTAGSVATAATSQKAKAESEGGGASGSGGAVSGVSDGTLGGGEAKGAREAREQRIRKPARRISQLGSDGELSAAERMQLRQALHNSQYISQMNDRVPLEEAPTYAPRALASASPSALPSAPSRRHPPPRPPQLHAASLTPDSAPTVPAPQLLSDR